jgi:RecB family exonuclease
VVAPKAKPRPVLIRYKCIISLSAEQWDWVEDQAHQRGETGNTILSSLLSQAIFLKRAADAAALVAAADAAKLDTDEEIPLDEG